MPETRRQYVLRKKTGLVEIVKTKPHNPIFASLGNGISDDENSEVVATVNYMPLNTISDSKLFDSSDED